MTPTLSIPESSSRFWREGAPSPTGTPRTSASTETLTGSHYSSSFRGSVTRRRPDPSYRPYRRERRPGESSRHPYHQFNNRRHSDRPRNEESSPKSQAPRNRPDLYMHDYSSRHCGLRKSRENFFRSINRRGQNVEQVTNTLHDRRSSCRSSRTLRGPDGEVAAESSVEPTTHQKPLQREEVALEPFQWREGLKLGSGATIRVPGVDESDGESDGTLQFENDEDLYLPEQYE